MVKGRVIPYTSDRNLLHIWGEMIMIRSPLFLLITSIICVLVGLYIQSSYIEIFASVMGIINVWLLAREKYPTFIRYDYCCGISVYFYYTRFICNGSIGRFSIYI